MASNISVSVRKKTPLISIVKQRITCSSRTIANAGFTIFERHLSVSVEHMQQKVANKMLSCSFTQFSHTHHLGGWVHEEDNWLYWDQSAWYSVSYLCPTVPSYVLGENRDNTGFWEALEQKLYTLNGISSLALEREYLCQLLLPSWYRRQKLQSCFTITAIVTGRSEEVSCLLPLPVSHCLMISVMWHILILRWLYSLLNLARAMVGSW